MIFSHGPPKYFCNKVYIIKESFEQCVDYCENDSILLPPIACTVETWAVRGRRKKHVFTPPSALWAIRRTVGMKHANIQDGGKTVHVVFKYLSRSSGGILKYFRQGENQPFRKNFGNFLEQCLKWKQLLMRRETCSKLSMCRRFERKGGHSNHFRVWMLIVEEM